MGLPECLRQGNVKRFLETFPFLRRGRALSRPVSLGVKDAFIKSVGADLCVGPDALDPFAGGHMGPPLQNKGKIFKSAEILSVQTHSAGRDGARHLQSFGRY